MEERFLLMRDVVDNQILDVTGRRVTKVAGLEVELRDGARPRVVALLVGPEPLARRLGGRVAWACGVVSGRRRTVRIPWEQVQDVGPDVRLRVTAESTGATHAEDWVRDHIVRWLPSIK